MRAKPSARSFVIHAAMMMLAALAWPAARLTSQSLTVRTVGNVLQVQAPGLRFVEGEPLARLKDGQSVRVDFELAVLAKPGGQPAAERRQTFVLSYDLWEERFAVTLPGEPASSISHLTATAAEAWCLQQLTVPVSALGQQGRDLPFWIRLAYRVLDGTGAPERAEDAGLTLGGLIDLLSSKARSGELSHSVEAGPFRVKQ
jgi:hypothetical protein